MRFGWLADRVARSDDDLWEPLVRWRPLSVLAAGACAAAMETWPP